MKSNQRVLLMLPLLLIAGGLALFGDKTPSGRNDGGGVVGPANGDAMAQSSNVPSGVIEPLPEAETPPVESVPEDSSVHRMRDRTYLGQLENEPRVDLFQVPPPAEEKKDEDARDAETEPPRQPFRLAGRMYDRRHWIVFLEHEDRTYVAKAGDVVEDFRVDAVNDQTIQLTKLADNSKYAIDINGEKKEPAHD